jgi:hypothetical protein
MDQSSSKVEEVNKDGDRGGSAEIEITGEEEVTIIFDFLFPP